MTKEYAINLLEKLRIGACFDARPIIPQYEMAQALEIALDALKQQPTKQDLNDFDKYIPGKDKEE